MYADFVAPRGFIVFHDIIGNPAYPEYGVHVLWARIRQEFPQAIEIVYPGPCEGFGIGILQKPDETCFSLFLDRLQSSTC